MKPANRRFKRLLSYKTYFLLDTNLAYPPKLVRKAHRLNKDMDGAFQGQALFSGKDPLGLFTFLSTFKRACDASGITHGQALALLGFRLAGDAKRSFASAIATKGARDRYAIRTYGDGVNWLLKKYASPDVLSRAYTDVVTARQEPEEAPRAFGERVERMCDRLDGLFRARDVTDSFVTGLQDAVKAHVLAFQLTRRNADFPEVVTAAQIYWEGVRQIKIDVRRSVSNTTTVGRPGSRPASPLLAAAVAPPVPPAFARADRGVVDVCLMATQVLKAFTLPPHPAAPGVTAAARPAAAVEQRPGGPAAAKPEQADATPAGQTLDADAVVDEACRPGRLN
ncbi:hypothetical protein MMPV_007267 [Pyropia vietnamensis]